MDQTISRGMESDPTFASTVVGFDLDGVLASQDIRKLIALDGLKASDFDAWFEIAAEHFASQVPLLTEHLFDGTKMVIITARMKVFEPLTRFWLNFFYGENYTLYCVGYDKNTKARKLEIIKNEGIKLFIDDNKSWVKYLRDHGVKGIHWD